MWLINVRVKMIFNTYEFKTYYLRWNFSSKNFNVNPLNFLIKIESLTSSSFPFVVIVAVTVTLVPGSEEKVLLVPWLGGLSGPNNSPSLLECFPERKRLYSFKRKLQNILTLQCFFDIKKFLLKFNKKRKNIYLNIQPR